MTNFIKVNSDSRFVDAIIVGAGSMPGYEYIEQSSDLSHICAGWSYTDGQWTDTTSEYRTSRSIRGIGTNRVLASNHEA